MIPFHPFLAFSFSALIGLLGCIFFAFVIAFMLSLLLIPVEEWVYDVVFKWSIKNRNRHRLLAIFFAHQHPGHPDSLKVFNEVSSLNEMAFLCEAFSHAHLSENYRRKKYIKDRLYQYIHTENPLYVKYLVEALMAQGQGWDINSTFNIVYKRDTIQELVNESLFSNSKKPDPAIWQEWNPHLYSVNDFHKEYLCIGTLAALLKANHRYDTLYLLLKSFPQFEKSCAPLFNIEPSDLPDFLLISAYKAYKFTD